MNSFAFELRNSKQILVLVGEKLDIESVFVNESTRLENSYKALLT